MFTSLPKEIGFSGTPAWWPLPLLALAGVIVACVIVYLPGTAGYKPAEGFKAGGSPTAIELPGVVLASLATLSLGVVLGPEAPLIAMAGGLGMWAVNLAKKDASSHGCNRHGFGREFRRHQYAVRLAGSRGLLVDGGVRTGWSDAWGRARPRAAGRCIGTLIFVGLDSLTGFGTFSLSIAGLPPFSHPNGVMFLWAIVFGLGAAVLGTGIRLIGLFLQAIVERRMLVLMPLIGLGVAGLAVAFAEGTGRSASEVLFSGQSALPTLVLHASGWTIGALVLLVACKSLAYCL